MSGFMDKLLPSAVAGSPCWFSGGSGGRPPRSQQSVNRYRVVAAFSVPDHGTTFRDLAFPVTASVAEGGLLDLEQELGVALGLAPLLHEQLESLLGLQGVQHPAQLPDDLELLRREQDLLLTGARRVPVDRGEQPLLGELTAQPQLRDAGTRELLEDHLVHPGAGL